MPGNTAMIISSTFRNRALVELILSLICVAIFPVMFHRLWTKFIYDILAIRLHHFWFVKYRGQPDRVWRNMMISNGPLTRYAKLRVAHAPGMPGTFFPPPRISNLDMHHGTCVTHVPWCMPGSLTSGLLWSRWRGKRSRHSWRMRNPPFNVTGKRPMKQNKLTY